MRQCEWEDIEGRCDNRAVLIWKWAKGEEHFCAYHFDMYAKRILAGAEETSAFREIIRRNGLR